jgi:ATP-dependent RNA helicase RhlE
MKFSDLNLNKALLNAIDDLGFETPTPIQERAFRQWTYQKNRHPQVLIVVPTRELVAQIVKEIEKLTTYMNVEVVGVYGGTNVNTQAARVVQGLDFLVATPGRLLDLILNGSLKMKYIKKFIVDEVDEMLGLGFLPQLKRILDFLPEVRQNLMFSATMTEEIDQLIKDFFNRPTLVEATPTGTPLEKIHQTAYRVPNFYSKLNLLETLLRDEEKMTKVLVFVESKKYADMIFEKIDENLQPQMGIIHSNKAQNNRFQTVQKFKDGETRILIATDIISRGLDILEVSHVINFDTPEIPEDYIHRIGRTGRADAEGVSITLVNDSEIERQEAIESLMNKKIEVLANPEGYESTDILLTEEIPKIKMKIIEVKIPKKDASNAAFHEKKLKNQKVNVRLTLREKLAKKGKKMKFNK